MSEMQGCTLGGVGGWVGRGRQRNGLAKAGKPFPRDAGSPPFLPRGLSTPVTTPNLTRSEGRLKLIAVDGRDLYLVPHIADVQMERSDAWWQKTGRDVSRPTAGS